LPARRDDSDRQLVHRLIERRVPILAVGLGLQQLNVALGGTLFMHLPEELPRSMPHRDPAGQTHRHMVQLEPGSRLEEIYGGIEIRVNSAHHQAVRQLGKGLRIAARSPDGVIEAVESTSPEWFCIGVQWHPEADTSSALDLQLFECFAQACLRQAQSLQEAA
jgi:putative glutamine amidotransferase